MNTLHASPTIRLAAAIAAVGVTTTLFSAVVSLSEPQRGELWSLNKTRAAPTVTAMAPESHTVASVK